MTPRRSRVSRGERSSTSKGLNVQLELERGFSSGPSFALYLESRADENIEEVDGPLR
eukprot:CAMPEP_0181125454 /NCGR_PEP_ID=MMETSP1071-20121207/27060_1 /TAXON_ID=35127 /ORGANISM="Thalassiosira sp., Strain NH16" /LENGTH=56 /DNA_ID=CAMNT_0023210901 /DNA_START=106 /DNA_END=273 /DNA_ORIENTATION=+